MFNPGELSRIYDGMKKKDMPKADFIAQAQQLMDPGQMKRDAMKILAGKRKKEPVGGQ